jgi:hypothetical protein
MMAAGLRAIAKAMEQAPEPKSARQSPTRLSRPVGVDSGSTTTSLNVYCHCRVGFFNATKIAAPTELNSSGFTRETLLCHFAETARLLETARDSGVKED